MSAAEGRVSNAGIVTKQSSIRIETLTLTAENPFGAVDFSGEASNNLI
jgi:hypothetical protein